MVAVPLPSLLAVKVTPDGRLLPTSVIVRGAGKPAVVVTVKEPAAPTAKVA